MNTVENRYDFVYLFDCQDGNPNGDPDADNSPRFDAETLQGLVSDVCLKRKIRDYVRYAKCNGADQDAGYKIFVLSGNTLESNQRLPFQTLDGPDKIVAKGKDTAPSDIEKARDWMCANFFDVRAFGAVMTTTDFNCGQVRGPVQLTFARSIDRVLATEHTISRQAFTGEKDVKSGTGTLGRKHTISYGLYRANGFINPVFAAKTGFHEGDLQLLWKALANLFDLDRSAARGTMAARGLHIFRHDSKLGNASAQRLLDSVEVRTKEGIETPRSFGDYTVALPAANALPPGVTLLDGLSM